MAKNRKILAASMVPQQGPGKYPASPMLARAKFLTSRSRKNAEAVEQNADNASVKTAKSEEHLIGEELEASENSNKKNIIERIRSVVSSSPQNVSTSFQPVLPPPTTANKIGRFFSLKSGGFFGGKSNLMDTVPSGSNTSLNSLSSMKSMNDRKTPIDPKMEQGMKNKKNLEDSKKLQEQQQQQNKKGLQRTGSLKRNKVNGRDSSTDKLGNENRKGLVLQSQDKSKKEEGAKQSGAFYTLNKAGQNNIQGNESRKIPGGSVQIKSARGNNLKNLGEKDVRKGVENVTDTLITVGENITNQTREKVRVGLEIIDITCFFSILSH